MDKNILSLDTLVFDQYGRQVGFEIPEALLSEITGGLMPPVSDYLSCNSIGLIGS